MMTKDEAKRKLSIIAEMLDVIHESCSEVPVEYLKWGDIADDLRRVYDVVDTLKEATNAKSK